MERRTPKKKTTRAWAWTLAAALATTTAAASWWPRKPTAEDPAVKTAEVVRGTLERTVVATGVLRPVVGAEIDVGCRISGTVVDLPVEVGDVVVAGQLLAQLDTTELDAVIAQTRAELTVARAEVEMARSAHARREHLAREGVVPAEELELARRDLDVKTARVEDAEARLRVAEINRGYTTIKAPIRGVIAAVTTREGETVAATFAAPTFVTIIDLDRLEVRAFVDETDVGRIFVGQSAVFTVDTYPDREVPAVVRTIEPKAEIQSNVVNYVAVLDYEAPADVVLRPEMTTHVRLDLERHADVLSVPRNALRRRDGRTVVTVRRGGAWSEQTVTTGWRTDLAVEILEGLDEGETVMINPS